MLNLISKEQGDKGSSLSEYSPGLHNPDKADTMPATPFDNLMLRKFSQIEGSKSAFAVLSLVQWYIRRLKILVKMSPEDKKETKQRLRANLDHMRNADPFLPSCNTKCGLVQGISCSKTHVAQNFVFFAPKQTSDQHWPSFDKSVASTTENLFNLLEARISNLPWVWSSQHEFLLREHIFTILASYVSRGACIKNMRMSEVQYMNKKLTVAIGRRQATCQGGVQVNLGIPVFRTALSSVFALCMIRLQHLLSDHSKVRTKLSILSSGWMFQDLANVCRSAEQMCMKCRLHKATNPATTSSLYTTVSGNSFNLGTLASSPNTHFFAVDGMGPFQGKDSKYYSYIFISNTNRMCYSMTVNNLSLQTLVETIEQLTSFVGSCTFIMSDQAGAFEMCATLLELEGKMEAGLPPARQPKHPMYELLQKRSLERSGGGITWRLVCASSGEAMGSCEIYIKILKEALRGTNFYQQCHTLTHSEMASYFAAATKLINSRPCIQLEDGRIFSAFDLLNLSMLGGNFPDHELQVSSDNKRITSKLDYLAKLKQDLQLSIFTKYTKHLFFSSDFRQRANFQVHAMHLEPGDLIFSRKTFELTKSLTGSLRRIALLDTHKKHAIVYHQINPDIRSTLDVKDFTLKFNKCKTKEEKCSLVSRCLGRHSFESVDLRKCAFVTKQSEGPHIDSLFRRSNDQNKKHPIKEDLVFDIKGTERLLRDQTPGASAVLPILPLEAVKLAANNICSKKEKGF